jgi:hypothetical protein
MKTVAQFVAAVLTMLAMCAAGIGTIELLAPWLSGLATDAAALAICGLTLGLATACAIAAVWHCGYAVVRRLS